MYTRLKYFRLCAHEQNMLYAQLSICACTYLRISMHTGYIKHSFIASFISRFVVVVLAFFLWVCSKQLSFFLLPKILLLKIDKFIVVIFVVVNFCYYFQEVVVLCCVVFMPWFQAVLVSGWIFYVLVRGVCKRNRDRQFNSQQTKKKKKMGRKRNE